MVFKRLYYLVKPFIPLRLRLALRRYHAQRRRNACRDLWPIDPNSAEPPPGWTGWPEGKQFAVVLTHDVEGSRGFSRVERLMNVDRNYGFRSSFNFVPHGEYRLTSELCTLLESSGCEIGR